MTRANDLKRMRCGSFFAAIFVVAGCGGDETGTQDPAAGGATGGDVGAGGMVESQGGSPGSGGAAASSGGAAASSGGTVGGGGAGAATGGTVETGGSSVSTGGNEPSSEPTDVPVIDSLIAAIDDAGAIAVEFEGRGGPSPLNRIVIELLDADGNVLDATAGWGSWLVRMNRLMKGGSAGHVEQSGARLSGFMSFLDLTLVQRPERVRVTLLDREENLGPPFEAALSEPAPVTIEQGTLCDPFGVLNRCESPALCDAVNGVGRVAPTCQLPSEECPLEMLELRDAIHASNAESPDATSSSCTFTRGQLGNDQGHVFVASKSGTHRFRAEETDYQAVFTLYARRFCDLGIAPESELGCAHVNDAGGAGNPIELSLELEAGQTIYVYVESSWVNGGEYVLSVEEPE